jgi:hypothetical protein
MEVSRKQLQQVLEAFLAAFNYAQLEQLVFFHLEPEKDLEDIASSETEFPRVCFKLIRQAEREGWLEDLIRAAIKIRPRSDKFKALGQELQLDSEKASPDAASGVRDRTRPNEDDPLVVIYDFEKDLEEIPADESWSSEEYEDELESLQSRLPNLRAGARSLLPKQETDLAQCVLSELRFEDIVQATLGAINAFEIGLNGLLVSSRPQGSPNQTIYVQFCRRKSRDLSEVLSRLRSLGMNPHKPRQSGDASVAADLCLYKFIRLLRESHVSDLSDEEHKKILNMYSGVDVSITAVINYLNDPGVPSEDNVRKVRELLVSVGAFIADTALAQRRLPAMPGSVPLFPSREGLRLQKMCTKALDDLDLYNQIYRDLISSLEVAELGGIAVRADPGRLYTARRSLIDSLAALRRRIAALPY